MHVYTNRVPISVGNYLLSVHITFSLLCILHAHAFRACAGQICPSNKFECIISPFDALTTMNTGGTVTYTAGCALNNNSTAGFAAAVAAAQAADYVVLGLGIDGACAAFTVRACVRACVEVSLFNDPSLRHS